MRNLHTAAPFGVYRSSGSSVRLPTSVTWFSFAIVLSPPFWVRTRLRGSGGSSVSAPLGRAASRPLGTLCLGLGVGAVGALAAVCGSLGFSPLRAATRRHLVPDDLVGQVQGALELG